MGRPLRLTVSKTRTSSSSLWRCRYQTASVYAADHGSTHEHVAFPVALLFVHVVQGKEGASVREINSISWYRIFRRLTRCCVLIQVGYTKEVVQRSITTTRTSGWAISSLRRAVQVVFTRAAVEH